MEDILKRQRTAFDTGFTLNHDTRRKALETLKALIKDNEQAIIDALREDLGKSAFEAYMTEVGYTLHSIDHTLKHLKGWMKKHRVKTPFYHGLTRSWMQPEPLGNVLVLAPFNYPFHLLIEPLVGALAAGNTVILKPSEQTPATERLLMKLFDTYFEGEHVTLVTGEKDVAALLTSLPFDHIFFTGSTQVGKHVYEAAAKNLTPVTLELGGKSPTIVTASADLRIAAKRIVFGKFINAGQTCIAPDYVYVERSVKNAFMGELMKALKAMYPTDATHLGKIVNRAHFERLENLIDDNLVFNTYEKNKEKLRLTPVVMDEPDWTTPVMKEEIFGPILPVLTYGDLETLIGTLNEKPKPLALYLFTSSKAEERTVLRRVPSGSAAINDTITQVANVHLPFGGVGQSGFGRYHGKYSFETFSHFKTVVKKSTRFDPPLIYPPYTSKKHSLVRRLFK